MAIVINLDVMLAKRKMKSKELAEIIGITTADDVPAIITPKNVALKISMSEKKVTATTVPITALAIKLKSVSRKADPMDLKSSPIFKLVPLSNKIKTKVIDVNIGPIDPK